MSRARYWTCQRQRHGVKCGQRNSARRRYCQACGKPRPQVRRPEHLKALDLPYEDYVELNGGRETCGICGATGKTRRLHRDHDHRTGRARGLLCFSCNSLLPSRVDVGWLRSAADYLDRAKARS